MSRKFNNAYLDGIEAPSTKVTRICGVAEVEVVVVLPAPHNTKD